VTASKLKDYGALLTLALGLAGALWSGWEWKMAQDAADVKVEVEVAPAVKAQAKTLTAVRKTLDLLAEDKLATQVAMEQKCEQPGNDMPKDYCSDVLLKKRMRDAREAATAAREAQP
jgi:hypothetical protein